MKFKIINSDQGHHYYHTVEAVDKETAIKRFEAGHYGQVISCDEIKPPGKLATLMIMWNDQRYTFRTSYFGSTLPADWKYYYNMTFKDFLKETLSMSGFDYFEVIVDDKFIKPFSE